MNLKIVLSCFVLFFSNSFGSLNQLNLASLCTLRIETRTLWDIPVTQAGSKWWSDKLGYLSVSVPYFSNNCRQSRVIQITFCYKLVLFARHTLELCPCPVPLYFFPSCLSPFFSVTCCSQLSILAVLLSVSLPGSWHVVAVVQKESLINDNCTQDRGANADEFELVCEDRLLFADSLWEGLTLNSPSIIHLWGKKWAHLQAIKCTFNFCCEIIAVAYSCASQQ